VKRISDNWKSDLTTPCQLEASLHHDMLDDTSIPYSTYAKILVDVATAAGQRWSGFLQECGAGSHSNAMATLNVFDEPVTIEAAFGL